MNTKTLLALFTGFLLPLGCASPAAPATPTQLPLPTPTLFIATQPGQSLTALPGVVTPGPGTANPAVGGTMSICNDPGATALIDSFKKAVLNADGALLSSLVSPARGLDVALFRDGTVITYDQQHARFLFETTFEVDWGAEPGSGAAKRGSFHDVVVPQLVKDFNQPYTLHCNELKHGGATYELTWPYQGEFYSVYYPGTEANGNMDWHTWAMGIEHVNSKPYIYALLPFFWEP